MNEYYMPQKISSAYCQTIVKNPKGRPVFFLTGRWGCCNDTISLYRLQGDLAAEVKQTSTGSQYRFELFQDGKKIGNIYKLFPLNVPFYYVRRLNWFIFSFDQQQFVIRDRHTQVMTIKKIIHPQGDVYHLMIFQSEYIPTCICITAILDYWLWNKKKDTYISKIKSEQFIKGPA